MKCFPGHFSHASAACVRNVHNLKQEAQVERELEKTKQKEEKIKDKGNVPPFNLSSVYHARRQRSVV